MLVSTLDEFIAAEELHPHCRTLPSHRLSPRHNRLQMRVGWVWLEKVCDKRLRGKRWRRFKLNNHPRSGCAALADRSQHVSGFRLFAVCPQLFFLRWKKRTRDKGSMVSHLDIWCNIHYDRSQAGLMLFCIKSQPHRVRHKSVVQPDQVHFNVCGLLRFIYLVSLLFFSVGFCSVFFFFFLTKIHYLN